MKTCVKSIAILLILTFVFSFQLYDRVYAESGMPEGFEKVSENSALVMYANMSNGQFAVINKSTGFTWWSNPPKAQEDTLAKGIKRMRMLSQLLVTLVDNSTQFTDVNSNVACLGEKGLVVEKTENGIQSTYTFPREKITIPIAVSLHDDYFQVEVLTSGIREKENKIVTIELLPYLGAGSIEDEGYMVVPDGSGALIHFNNGKQGMDPYEQDIYGKNKALTTDYDYIVDEPVRLPVFGIRNGDNGLLGVVTKGASTGFIKALVSRRESSYNNVYAGFQYREIDNVIVNSGKWQSKKVKVVEPGAKYSQPLEIRYYLLDGEQSDYAGMALRYQKYLVDEQNLKKQVEQSSVPFYMDLYGGVKKAKSFLGIPIQLFTPLTTYSECVDIMKELKQNDIDNIVFRYNGWLKGGIFDKLPSTIKLERKLGGEKEFKKLISYTTENQVEFYPNVDWLNFYKSGNGYSTFFSSARNISGTPAKQYFYKLDTSSKTPSMKVWYLLAPKNIFHAAVNCIKSFRKYSIGSISLSSMGDTVYSDFSGKGLAQPEVEDIWEKVLDYTNVNAGKVMVEGGNAYSIPYARHIVNAPIYTSSFDIEDEQIPFYQIVVHGYVSYSAPSANLSSQPVKHLLRCLETGSNLQFSWIARDSSLVKDTWFDYIYGADFSAWKEDAVAMYKELNSVLSKVANARITRHSKLLPGVFETVYENGVRILVNYNSQDAYIDGIRIAAEGYAVEDREGDD